MLFDCIANTENHDFKLVIEDTIENEKKTSERESLKYFYQEISHRDFEQEAFDGLVSSMNDHPGLDHIKSMLFKGNVIVKGGVKVTVRGGGKVTVRGGGKVTVSSVGKMIVRGGGTVTVRGGGKVTVRGAGKVTVKGGGRVTVRGEGKEISFLPSYPFF